MAALNLTQQIQLIKPHHRHNSYAKYFNSLQCSMQPLKIQERRHLTKGEIETDLHLRLCQKMHLLIVVL